MTSSRVCLARQAATTAFALVFSGVVVAQTPSPSPTVGEKAQEAEQATLRIRGSVESVDESGLLVELSQGLTIKVDLQSEVPVYSAVRIKRDELKQGDTVAVRTRAAEASGDGAAASEVLVSPNEIAYRPGDMSVIGPFRAIETSGEKSMIALTEKGAERKVSLTGETTFWRLTQAALKDVKKGASVSILMIRQSQGPARPQWAVFGSPPPGAMLPL